MRTNKHTTWFGLLFSSISLIASGCSQTHTESSSTSNSADAEYSKTKPSKSGKAALGAIAGIVVMAGVIYFASKAESKE